MTQRAAVVATTIAEPTAAMREIAEGCAAHGLEFFVIGDQNGPATFDLPAAQFFDLPRQRELPFDYARYAPVRHYARKNVGYLLAMQEGAPFIIETDDDNHPLPGFWRQRAQTIRATVVEQAGWINVYRYFTDAHIWPRGLPLESIAAREPLSRSAQLVDAPIQQGLADGDPDVDAVYRMLFSQPVYFDQAHDPVALGPAAWCPFNSQNTTWFPPAYPLMYLPVTCSFRMTDIWRSFVAQRVAAVNGWKVAFHSSTVRQERNAHDISKDFADEMPGRLHNNEIRNQLEKISLEPGNIAAALVACYEALVSHGIIARDELKYLDYWVRDCAALGVQRSGTRKRDAHTTRS